MTPKKTVMATIAGMAWLIAGCGSGGGGSSSPPVPVGATIASVSPENIQRSTSGSVSVLVHGSFNEPAGNWGVELWQNGSPASVNSLEYHIVNVSGSSVSLSFSPSGIPAGTYDIVLFSNDSQVSTISVLDQITVN